MFVCVLCLHVFLAKHVWTALHSWSHLTSVDKPTASLTFLKYLICGEDCMCDLLMMFQAQFDKLTSICL